jgi:hypothetical protein
MQESDEIMDVVTLDGNRAGLRALLRGGMTPEEAAYELYGKITDAQGKESVHVQSAAICWLVQEAEIFAEHLADEAEILAADEADAPAA